MCALKTVRATIYIMLFMVCLRANAEDIDIFVGSSGGSAGAPNVMILLDNSPNWSRASQHWPDDSGNQGESELKAIATVLDSITSPVNVGLAMLTDAGPDGGYIRFAARDMSIAANRTAFKAILNAINVNSPSEKVNGMAHKNESAGFYEVYKYFSSLAPYSGMQSHAPLVDVTANSNTLTGYGQGLRSGFAISSNLYTPPSATGGCAKNYMIYIANNANNTGSSGAQSYESSVLTAVSTLSAPSGTLVSWTDEWAKTLYNNGIVTYVLDAYYAQQNASYSLLLQNAAKMGGGSYTQVGNKSAIVSTLLRVFSEIQSVNTTFASASLPVNATNRAQNQNQVFIGMFRPDADAKPRWFGNMKRYQLVNNNGSIDLGDANGASAVNTQTGFLTSCATSYWTNDSGSYWSNVPITPVPSGSCATTTYNAFSDAPDGPFVEKGGVAEIIRQGNNPPSTSTTPTWALNRTVYTLSGTSLASFSTTTSGLSANLVNFILGKDVNDENGNGNVTETRPSLHGDVIHSRPLPVTYSGSTGVVVFAGSNDGMLRASNAVDGKERWAFVAPEFFSKFQRLSDNSPLINYPNLPSGITPTPTAKDYFFDGSIGLYQNADNSNIWIYPTMRRGGRMIYGLDVTNPASPSFKWKVGCPNLTNDTGCTTGSSGIGQTWSMPNVGFIKGYSTTDPVVIVGGGYDACEDANSSTPSCTAPKGAVVYILNANTGSIIASFSTTRSVAADVSLIDIDRDGYVDYAYAADTGGNIYRINFIDNPSTRSSLSSTAWAINRVAYTNGSGRKFLYAPALFYSGYKVYLAIGSGDREHPLQTHYPYTTPITNRFYVYLDDLASSTAFNLDSSTAAFDYTSASTCNSEKLLPSTSSYKGWFINLNNGTGEQVVTSGLIVGGMVTFSTNRPIPSSSGTCSTILGEARGYWLNLLNASGAIGVSGSCGGTRSSTFVGGGLPPSPVLGVVPVNGVQKTVVIGATQKNGGVSSPIGSQQIRPAIGSVRKKVYWYSSGNN